MDEIIFTELNRIRGDKGDVAHILKNPDFRIEEVYMSSVSQGAVKGWKRHNRMTLNLVVIKGSVKFTIVHNNRVYQEVIGEKNYGRLTVKPGLWVCFEGLEKENLIINCADMVHDPSEVDLKDLDD